MKLPRNILTLIWVTVAVVSLGVSCQKTVVQEASLSSSVGFTVELPVELQSKAIADGLSVNCVYWAAFDKDGEPVESLNGKIGITAREASFDVELVKDYPYHFVFWAQHEDDNGNQPAYDLTSFVSEGKIGVSYEGGANDEMRDAFYRQIVITITGAGEERTIELHRPFAQINFLAADYLSVEDVEAHKTLKSTLTVSGLPNVLNGLDGTVSGSVSTAFTQTAVPVDPAYMDIAGERYGWYSMNYVLASEEKELNNVVATFKHDLSDKPVDVTVTNVPYRRNFRTNIIGSFLTEIAVVNVVVMEEFEDKFFEVEY